MAKNVLFRRVPREYRKDIVKFGILHFFFIAIVAIVSGYLAGVDAIDRSYSNSQIASNVEDGHFTTTSAVEDGFFGEYFKDIKFFNQSYIDETIIDGELTKDDEIRIFKNREEINLVTVNKGKLPTEIDEIAVDGLYAKTNKVKLNDIIKTNKREYKVVGFISMPDYAVIFKSASSLSFQHYTFCPTVVSDILFDSFNLKDLIHCYSYKFNETYTKEMLEVRNASLYETLNKKLMSKLIIVSDFMPASMNRAIKTPKGFSKQYDALVLGFNFLVVFIISFVFSISTLSRIVDEAKTLGTLRALGFSKKALTATYLILPVFVILVSSIIGNLIGYTLLAGFFSELFLSFFSIPTIKVAFSLQNFLMTTVAPSLVLFILNLIVISQTMEVSPLNFLRNKVIEFKQRKAIKLNENSKFLTKFRIRTLTQNVPNFIVLLVGVILGSVIFSFGLLYKASADNQLKIASSQTFADYQYIVDLPMISNDPDVESFSVYSLNSERKGYVDSTISIYGLKDNSKYVNITFDEEHSLYVSSAFATKFNYKVGSTFELSSIKRNTNYKFTIDGIYDYMAVPCVFMPQEKLNDIIFEDFNKELLDVVDDVAEFLDIDIDILNKVYFNGYFSNKVMEDLPNERIQAIITSDSIYNDCMRINDTANKVSILVVTVGIAMDILLVFLLTKQIVEKNQNNISLCKVLGFSDKEIGKVYIASTSIVVVLGLLIALPIIYLFFTLAFPYLFYPTMESFIHFIIPWWVYPGSVLCGLLAYLVSTYLQYKNIKKIPMTKALINGK